MERYEAYKDSGIEWIGEIPWHWRIAKLLFGLRCAITDGPHESPEFFQDGIPFISAEAVSCGNGYIDFSHMRGLISQEYYDLCCEKYIPELNDIYMIKSGATTGRVAIVNTEKIFTIWSPLAAIRCDCDKLIPKYAFYFLQAEGFQKQVEDGWTYGTQQNIGMRTLEKLKLCYPSLSEQQAIADYLDAKTAEIDELVSDVERSIELLQEYRKAVISEAVTKGLDPDVPMKDSGIEWIGEIPEDWHVEKLKYLCKMSSGATPSKEYINYWQGNIPWVSSKEVKASQLWDTSLHISQEGMDSCSTELLPAGTLATVVRSGILKHTLPVCELMVPMTVNQDIKALQFHDSHIAQWFKYFVAGENDLLLLNLKKDGATVDSLDLELFASCPIVVPPHETIFKIVSYLEPIIGNIDSISFQKRAFIEKLKEYRKSIISEAVTGKFKVPEVS